MEIAFACEAPVRAALSRIGRTEDAAFSPGGGLIAVAGLARNRLLVLRLETRIGLDPPAITLSGAFELESDALRYPHGLAWIDERTLIVASRGGEIAIFSLPDPLPIGRRARLDPILLVGAADHVKTPGSVSILPLGLDLFELLVCNNYVNQVSRHLLDRRDGLSLIASEILLDHGLAVPDGVAHSPTGRWVAVSNHDRHCVHLYRNDRRLNPESRPDGVLHGFRYPHGLRFADETRLLVADAGSLFVHLFECEDGDWSGDRDPARSIAAVAEATFARGRYNMQEGGPKGVDLTPDGAIMVVTCEEQPLAFFDLRPLLGRGTDGLPAPGLGDEADQSREALLRHIALAQARLRDATEVVRRSGEREMHSLLSSRSWRITAPLRRLSAAAERARRWIRRRRH